MDNNMKHTVIRLLTAFALLWPLFATTVQAEEELLDPDKAFAFSTEIIDGRTIRASWQIADGYYMYRKYFKFNTDTPGAQLGEPVIPPGKMKKDPTYNEVLEIYKHGVSIDIPILATDASGNINLIAKSQGCNEPIGVCYPPMTHTVALTVNPPITAGTPEGGSAVAALGSLSENLGLGGNDEVPPMPDEAFQLSLKWEDANTLLAHWKIGKGAYLYADKFVFRITDGRGHTLGEVKLPEGKRKYDDVLEKEVVAYYKKLDVRLPIAHAAGASPTFTLYLEYQGCSETFGICYPPIRKLATLGTDGVIKVSDADAAPAADAPAAAPVSAAPAETTAGSEDDHSDWGLIAILAFAFGSGLLLTFTPCVLPMLPIIGGIIIGQGDKVTPLRGGLLATVYVLGTAVVWTGGGILAGATGQQLAAYTSHPIFVISVSVILLLLALAMFGKINIQLPSSLQSRAQEKSQAVKGGTFVGVFLMGVLASVIAGACVSPILILNLGVAMQAQDPTLGGMIMFLMALGMGVPIILMGFGAGALIPKAGPWMDTVKYIFGVLLIGLVIYLLALIPWMPVLYFWGVFLVILGVYLGATQSLPEGVSGWRIFWKGIGTVLIVWGIMALIGASQGGRSIMSPLTSHFGAMAPAGGAATASTEGAAQPMAEVAHFRRVKNLAELNAALAAAKAAGKPVMLDYYADWCTDCVRMEQSTFRDPRVAAKLKGFVMLQADVTDQFNPDTQPLKDRFGVFGPPAMLFFDADGELKEKLYGYRNADDFLELLNRI